MLTQTLYDPVSSFWCFQQVCVMQAACDAHMDRFCVFIKNLPVLPTSWNPDMKHINILISMVPSRFLLTSPDWDIKTWVCLKTSVSSALQSQSDQRAGRLLLLRVLMHTGGKSMQNLLTWLGFNVDSSALRLSIVKVPDDVSTLSWREEPHVNSLIEKANVFALTAGLSSSFLIRGSQCRGTRELVLHTSIRTPCVPAGTAYRHDTNGTWRVWLMRALNELPAVTHISRVVGNWTQITCLVSSKQVRPGRLSSHSGLISTLLHVHHLVQLQVDENTEHGLTRNEQRSHREIAPSVKDYFLLEVMSFQGFRFHWTPFIHSEMQIDITNRVVLNVYTILECRNYICASTQTEHADCTLITSTKELLYALTPVGWWVGVFMCRIMKNH